MTVPTRSRPRLSSGTSSEPAANTASAGPRRRDTRRRRRIRSGTAAILAGAGAAALLAAGVLGYRYVSHEVLGPQSQVKDYLTALASGDQAAAHALLPSTDALIPADPAVYARAGHRITGFEIVDQQISGGRAVVQALVDQDGERKNVEFRLTDNGPQALIFRSWQLHATAARTVELNVPADTAEIRINGVPLALPDGPAEVLLLPGSYLIQGPEHRWLSYGIGETVVVDAEMAGNPEPVRLRAAVTPELAAEVQAQGEAYLASCLSLTDAAPAACPNAAYTGYGPERYRDMQWTLERAPQYRIIGSPETGLEVYATRGKARAVYQEDTSGSGRWETRTDLVNIPFGSELRLAGDAVSLDFRP